MGTEVRLLQVAEGMTAARVAIWLKRQGDPVAAGEALAEVETDKTSVEIEAPAGGVLGAILVAAGANEVPVGTVLAVIEEAGEETRPDDVDGAVESGSSRTSAAATDVQLTPSPTDQAGDHEVQATPLARRMAAVAGLDLSSIAFDGDRARRGDVERALGQAAAVSTPVSAVPAGRVAPLSAARRVTAVRLQHAKQTVPHFYLEIECDAAPLLARRQALNARPGAAPLTITDFVVHAAARALRDVPAANVSWLGTDAGVQIPDVVDIAVAVNTPGGLLTPVVRAADTLALDDLAASLRALVERARAGRLAPAEYTGGTFTVSNLGMFGVRSLYPIVNPPQAAILGVGAVLPRALVRDGRLEAGAVLTCTLAADHRALDGAAGAEFLAAFRQHIEHAGTLQS